jgi:hypothetical protein
MTGYRLKAGDERCLAALRAIDAGVGEAGVLIRADDLNKWLQRMEEKGDDLAFVLESQDMSEMEFYGLGAETLASLGILSPTSA